MSVKTAAEALIEYVFCWHELVDRGLEFDNHHMNTIFQGKDLCRKKISAFHHHIHLGVRTLTNRA